MATGITTQLDIATDILNAVVAYFATAGVALPADQGVWYGERPPMPVTECERLAVCWERSWIGKAGEGEQGQALLPGKLWVGRFGVWIFRCVTQPLDSGIAALIEPTLAQVQADATTILTDAYVLAKALQFSKTNHAWSDDVWGVSLGPMVPVPVQGGIGGTYAELDVDLV